MRNDKEVEKQEKWWKKPNFCEKSSVWRILSLILQ